MAEKGDPSLSIERQERGTNRDEITSEAGKREGGPNKDEKIITQDTETDMTQSTSEVTPSATSTTSPASEKTIDDIVDLEMEQAKIFVTATMQEEEWLKAWLTESQGMLGRLSPNENDEIERKAILKSPLDREFYLSFLVMARNMLLVCESLFRNAPLPGGKGSRNKKQKAYYEYMVRGGITNIMDEVDNARLSAASNKFYKQSSAMVPSSLRTLLSLLISASPKREDQKRRVARVMRFVAVGNLVKYDSNGIKAVLEEVGRNLVRKRSLDREGFDKDLEKRCMYIPPHLSNTPHAGWLAATRLLECLMLLGGHARMKELMESRGMPRLALELHVPCLTAMLGIADEEVHELPVFGQYKARVEENLREDLTLWVCIPLDLAIRIIMQELETGLYQGRQTLSSTASIMALEESKNETVLFAKNGWQTENGLYRRSIETHVKGLKHLPQESVHEASRRMAKSLVMAFDRAARSYDTTLPVFGNTRATKVVTESSSVRVYDGVKQLNKETKQAVTIKVFRKNTDALQQKLEKVVRLTKCSNLVEVVGISKPPAKLACVMMKHVAKNLREYLQENRIGKDIVDGILLGIGRGLRHLHEHDIVHGDVRPHNILLERQSGDRLRVLVDYGSFGITPEMAYKAPETMIDGTWSPKSDMYSLGIVMWELLSEQVPFQGFEASRIAASVGFGKRPDAGLIDEDGYKSLMERLWNANPEKRPSADAFVTEIKGLHKSRGTKNNDGPRGYKDRHGMEKESR